MKTPNLILQVAVLFMFLVMLSPNKALLLTIVPYVLYATLTIVILYNLGLGIFYVIVAIKRVLYCKYGTYYKTIIFIRREERLRYCIYAAIHIAIAVVVGSHHLF